MLRHETHPAPGGVLNDASSCKAIYINEDVGIVSRTMSPHRGNGCQPFVTAVCDK